ncbi:putative ubiquitin-like activating enzyme [Basidiobolus meristosporus CBS 931.73]|uniref:Ubiquitin-activating enzyme E1-like n=1 Tax=Basidiobolus meristosporus CBS 931.73 TaxID=1314790 RepID=A0A1Y1Z719_9FUNG|nr:putative ubiquitin-like activating enzyme [Basidiobolus meristosporus CBS 931.73]|eukprot:ORY05605.1 putative ubiquitin-like activating enzyme [Basidiobolus meristosporus CBS 931.73]
MSHTTHLETCLGGTLFEKISSSKILVVGAGGIGCELLKNLVMSGFKNIEIVDLDTIDLSNLNRQFLFQKQHIKKSKAHVARESVLKFNPNVNILSHHANINDPQFSVEWFKRFDLVMNALDNLDARRRVNLMCLASDVPLIESGTAGYLGQVTVIRKGVTECFDCQPKPTPKTFPICTIRSTPSAPIHCIVWAKNYLFSQLFGKSDDDDQVVEGSDNTENAQEIESLRKEAESLKRLRESIGTPEYARQVFEKVFTDDINRLASMPDMWKSRQPPSPLSFEELSQLPQDSSQPNTAQLKDQVVWSIRENFQHFLSSTQSLSERYLATVEKDPEGCLCFDKDDDDSLDFVTATSNMRAKIFGIEEKSRFQVKAMAGNIIPAIATTNAIIAGLVVMEAYKILNNKISDCSTTYLVYGSRRPKLLYSEKLAPPNPSCYVCRNSHATFKANLETFTLQQFIDIVRDPSGSINMGEEITILEGERLLYDIEFEDNVESTFESLGLTNGKMVTVSSDEDSTKSIVFMIRQCDSFEQDLAFDIEGLAISNETDVTRQAKRKVEEVASISQPESNKRQATETNGVSQPEITVIEENDGVILLD